MFRKKKAYYVLTDPRIEQYDVFFNNPDFKNQITLKQIMMYYNQLDDLI